MMRRYRGRRGFALTVALWLLIALGTIAVAAMLAAREAVASASNRVGLARAGWLAEGCANETIELLDARLARLPQEGWETLDESPVIASRACRVTLRPAGLTLDVNRIGEALLIDALQSAGMPIARAESLAAAIVDWR